MATEQIWLVPGMSCGHCVAAVEEAVTGVSGVDAVTVDLESKRVAVRGEVSADAVATAIADAGYDATPVA